MEKYDMIVIGSGMGGMAAASAASQLLEAKVLLLEKHYVMGGYMHTFKRPPGYEWDVGLHYIGNIGQGSINRAVFDFVTKDGIEWEKMEEPFERYLYPNLEFQQTGNPDIFKSDLQARFPEEKNAIAQYFLDIKRAAAWLERRFMTLVVPFPLNVSAHLKNWKEEGFCLQTTKQYLDQQFKSHELKAILASQWGDCGLPPGKSAFAFHASIVRHYLRGGYYPIGGAGKIAESILPVIEENGGSCLLRHEATKIILGGNKAIGVEVKNKKETKQFFAQHIISDVGALNTYTKLLPDKFAPEFAQDINNSGISALVLYVGFKKDPSCLGFKGENYWIYTSLDHDSMLNEVLEGKISGCFLSFPSLKDRTKKLHTGEIITFAHYNQFKDFAGLPWKKRGLEYETLKDKISLELLSLVEQHHPGFRELIDKYELSTPLSNIHFTDHPQGSIYGMSGTPERFKEKGIGISTPVKNLYLVGADAFMPGIIPCLLSGLGAVGKIIGPLGMLKIQKEIKARTKKES